MRNLIVAIDTANAVTNEAISIAVLSAGIPLPLSERYPKKPAVFITDAPSIVGSAIKNENSAAALRDIPKQRAPIMVAPDRDVPGIIASD